MKYKKIIALMLVLLGFTFISAQQSNIEIVVQTFSWENGTQNVYLQAGTYRFEFEARVTTDVPYDETNTWNDCAFFSDGSYNFSEYSFAGWEVVNYPFYAGTPIFRVPIAGVYSIRAGSYEIWACTVNSNTAKLIRLNQFIVD